MTSRLNLALLDGSCSICIDLDEMVLSYGAYRATKLGAAHPLQLPLHLGGDCQGPD